MTYPDGSTVNYTYDKNNRMSTVANGEELPTQYQYFPSGTIASIKQPGSTTTYAYNALNLPKQVKYQLKDGTSLERNLTYDALGHMVDSKQTGSTKEFTRNSSYTYDALGRMLSKDPVKRRLNPYPYCKNSPKNYVDPTGEVANILAGGALGGIIGGAFGYVGSAISQKMNGERFNSKKAWGTAANGAVVGAVRGALVGSGVGMLGSLGANFGAGALGSAFEQNIVKGKVDFRQSVTDGLTNAVSSAIYGNGKLKSLGSAFLRGAGAGAATAAINNLSDALMPRQTKRSGSGRNGIGNSYTGGSGRSPYTRMRNPRACGAPSAFQGRVGYRNTYGYQYEPRKTQNVKRNKFSIGSFAKDVLLGAVMGGFSSALFYGAGKGVEKLAGSLKRRVKGSYKPKVKYNLQFFASKNGNRQADNLKSVIDVMKSGTKTADGKNIIATLDDNSKVIFRMDVGENAHKMINYGYSNPTNHINIEIQTASISEKFSPKWNFHMMLDNMGNVAKTFITGLWKNK